MDEFDRGNSFEANGRVFIDFHDEYEHLDANIGYGVECVLQTTNVDLPEFEKLRDNFNALCANVCSCVDEEDEEDGEDAAPLPEIPCMHDNCNHGNNYKAYNDASGASNTELVLNESRRSRDLIFECSGLCACVRDCGNRLIQFGPRKHLIIADFSRSHKQLGLITQKPIPAGGFICEYVGEVLSIEEAIRRSQENDANRKMNYIMCMNEMAMGNKDNKKAIQTFVDAGRIGNIGRYLNHSCNPNCEIISVRLDGLIPRICMKNAFN